MDEMLAVLTVVVTIHLQFAKAVPAQHDREEQNYEKDHVDPVTITAFLCHNGVGVL